MNALQEFLIQNTVDKITDKIVVSPRLKDHPFEIRAISSEEFTEYQKQCVDNPNSPKKRTINTTKLNNIIVVNHTIYPNFKDADWLKAAGAPDAASLVHHVLTAGEFADLAKNILTISGFNTDIEEEIEEVKNS